MHRDHIGENNLTPVLLICVSCSRRQVVHIPEWRCVTKEIHMECMECQESVPAIRDRSFKNAPVISPAGSSRKGGR